MNTRIKSIAVLGLIALAQPVLAQTPAQQSWTSSDGKVIQAKFIKLEGDFVTLEVGGQQHKFPRARLSPESTALAKTLSGVTRASAAPAPPASVPSDVAGSLGATQFLGKTFEECEKMLGQPTKIENPEGNRRSFSRSYKPSISSISQIKLERVPEGSMSGAVSETVNFVWYYFPKGTVKTMGECFKLTGAQFEGAYARVMKSGTSSGEFPDITAGDPLSDAESIRIEALPGRLVANWTPAAKSLNRPPEYRHENEDTLSFQAQIGPTMRERIQQVKEQMKKDGKVLQGPGSVVHDSPELRKNGAFGFPQTSAKVLADQSEARFSAWSNEEWLYVQIVVWADDDDTSVKGTDGTESCDQSLLHLDMDADEMTSPDHKYNLNTTPEKRGLHRQVKLGEREYTPLTSDSKGRGSIQFVPTTGGKKKRVDSYLLPLAELGKKAGDKIQLILSGKSVKPDAAFNSAGLRTNGKAMFYIGMPGKFYHDFTLGQQSGTIDPSLVPDGRDK
jgi:hypothetical protein